jgi:hypothetical protein
MCPYRGPSHQAASLESQTIRGIQQVLGRTLSSGASDNNFKSSPAFVFVRPVCGSVTPLVFLTIFQPVRQLVIHVFDLVFCRQTGRFGWVAADQKYNHDRMDVCLSASE